MTLTDVETDSEAYELPDVRVITGFYLNELLIRLLHQHEPHHELFDLYDTALSDLSGTKNTDQVLRIFEKGLLQSLGYGLVLAHDVDQGVAIQADKIYYYLLDTGPLNAIPLSDDYVKISGKCLLALNDGHLENKSELEEAKRLMRFILKGHLGSKPLSSRALYKAYIDTLNI